MANRTKWTIKKREEFLRVVRESANISEAARSVGLTRSRAYALREEDTTFAAEWDDAVEESLDNLEREARRRAEDGVQKPVFYQGVECGYVQEYSDSLLMFMLKGGRPEKYRDNLNVEHKGKITHKGKVVHEHREMDYSRLSDEELDQLERLVESAAVGTRDSDGTRHP